MRNKFWYQNEKRVMKKLGFNPQPGSGSGWIYKEDGENEVAICQLKSTEKNSFKFELVDLNKLIYHANISNKIPMFIIEFLNKQTWLCIRPEDLLSFAEYTINEKIKKGDPDLKIESKKEKKEIIKYTEKYIEKNIEKKLKSKKTLEDIWKDRKRREEKIKKIKKYKKTKT